MRPRLVTPPEPIPGLLANLKSTLRLEGVVDDDVRAQAFLDAAVAHMDGFNGVLGRCVMPQVWEEQRPAWTPVIAPAFPEARNVVVTYVDPQAAVQTVDPTEYGVFWSDHMGHSIWFREDFAFPALEPGPGPITVRYATGFASADDVPVDFFQAITFLAAWWFDGNADIPPFVQAFIARYRWVRV
jgi:uncharacterized phiE125 gp8 family phage protein